MPLLFSYGTLRDEAVQRSTFGRALHGDADVLIGFEQSLVTIVDPAFVAQSGKAEHAIIRFTGGDHHRVSGVAFEVTDDELADADAYEPEGFKRVLTTLASGRRAWVYVAEGS